jgi:hypothetical protein
MGVGIVGCYNTNLGRVIRGGIETWDIFIKEW